MTIRTDLGLQLTSCLVSSPSRALSCSFCCGLSSPFFLGNLHLYSASLSRHRQLAGSPLRGLYPDRAQWKARLTLHCCSERQHTGFLAAAGDLEQAHPRASADAQSGRTCTGRNVAPTFPSASYRIMAEGPNLAEEALFLNLELFTSADMHTPMLLQVHCGPGRATQLRKVRSFIPSQRMHKEETRPQRAHGEGFPEEVLESGQVCVCEVASQT